jgi:hypothetical protein
VVDRALEGRADELKERNIGIDVFARAADYDTSTDHVVRSVAGEVRRRLAQYYLEPERQRELRIDLLPGSYVPQFHFPAEPLVLNPAVTELEISRLSVVERALASVKKGFRRWIAVCAVAVALVVAASIPLLDRGTALQRFWNPIFNASHQAMLCAGGGGQTVASTSANEALTVSDYEHLPFRRMHTSDALALADIAALLESNRRPYRVLNRASGTSFRDLQSGPFVLIGGMNNEWTLRLTAPLRFSFEKQANGARIIDKQNPSNTAWSVDFTTPLGKLNRDYAIVSRVRDSVTEQTAVIVAGIGSWGTLAAAEFVTNPEHMKKLDGIGSKNWETRNIQIVIATNIIHGSSGPPNVLATHVW